MASVSERAKELLAQSISDSDFPELVKSELSKWLRGEASLDSAKISELLEEHSKAQLRSSVKEDASEGDEHRGEGNTRAAEK